MSNKRIDQFFKECDTKNEPVQADSVVLLDTEDLDEGIPQIKRVSVEKLKGHLGSGGSSPTLQPIQRKITIPIEFPEPVIGMSQAEDFEVITHHGTKVRGKLFENEDAITWGFPLPANYLIYKPFKFRVRGFILKDSGFSYENNINFNLLAVANPPNSKPTSSMPEAPKGINVSYIDSSSDADPIYFVTDWSSSNFILNHETEDDYVQMIMYCNMHESNDSPFYVTDIEILYTENPYETTPPTPKAWWVNPVDGQTITGEVIDVRIGLENCKGFKLFGWIWGHNTWHKVTDVNLPISMELFETQFPTNQLMGLADGEGKVKLKLTDLDDNDYADTEIEITLDIQGE